MGATYSSRVVRDPTRYATPHSEPASEKPANARQSAQYDYVIVGGGTAGCVLASRLSEDPQVTVLLLEAGQDHKSDKFTAIPFAFPKTFKTRTDWAYATTPQNALEGREVEWPRGRILGGTSAINALVYHRCAAEDFDEWAAKGAKGWGYADLQPYFLKAEQYTPRGPQNDFKVEHHGSAGPWKTGHSNPPPAIHNVLIQTCEAVGIAHTPDLNTEAGTLGVTTWTATVDKQGKRSSTATAYLTKEILKRPNLTIGIGAVVDKILFSSADPRPRATGVVLSTSRGSVRYAVTARREVIICGGAVNTPQLLMLSGIGPAKHLEDKGIQIVKVLPAVGQNLSDHFSTGGITLPTKPDMSWDHLMKPLHALGALLRWVACRSGPMGSMVFPGGAFLRSDDLESHWFVIKQGFTGQQSNHVKDFTSGPHAPDMEIVWTPLIARRTAETPPKLTGISMASIVLRPESVGSIELASSDPWDKPHINPNYVDSESDMNLLVHGARLILRMSRTEPLASALAMSEASDAIFWPTNTDIDQVSDDDLRTFIRKNGTTPWHPTSTARMGSSPADSVVDRELRVHGVDGLRIMDASVFPTQVSGHPCAVVVAMAEKAADIIKATYTH